MGARDQENRRPDRLSWMRDMRYTLAIIALVLRELGYGASDIERLNASGVVACYGA